MGSGAGLGRALQPQNLGARGLDRGRPLRLLQVPTDPVTESGSVQAVVVGVGVGVGVAEDARRRRGAEADLAPRER